jgi:hypothetical protein
MLKILRCFRWIAYPAVFAAFFWLAFWHHDDPRVSVPVFFTILFSWVALIFIIARLERRS